MDLSIAIVNFNTVDLLEECLSSLLQHPPSCDYEILVIDNASSDGSIELVREKFPTVKLFPNPRNVGYAAAINQAFRGSKAEYLLVLNPDVVVAQGAVDSLLDHMRSHPRVGIAGSKLLNPDGSLQYSCRRFYTLKTLLYRRTFLGKIFSKDPVVSEHLMADWDHSTPREVDWVLGACMMVRRSAVEEVGPADERFFLYFEDVDWCYRMKSRGWEVHYCPESVMVHHHRRDSARGLFGPGLRSHLASVFRFYEKWSMVAYILKRHSGWGGTIRGVIGDAAAVTVAFFCAYLIRQALSFLLKKPLFPISSYASFLVFTVALALISLSYFGLYRKRYNDWADELVDVAKALSVACVVVMASTFVLYLRSYSRIVLVSYWPLSILAVTGVRALQRRMTSAAWASGFGVRRVLIVGGAESRSRLEDGLRAGADGHIEIVAPPDRILSSVQSGDPGSPDSIARFVDEQRITDVLIVISEIPESIVAELMRPLRRSGVRVRLHTPAAGMLTSRSTVEELGDLGLIAVEEKVVSPADSVAKRAVDLALASIALLPLLLYMGLAKLRQGSRDGAQLMIRKALVGRGGRTFEAVLLADSDTEDSLPAGLRAKLPLIIHVVRGRLSFVGPKPLSPDQWREASRSWKEVRSHLVPGIVGTWCLKHPADAGAEKLETMDSQYLRDWSLGHDIKTMVRVLSGAAPPSHSGV